MNCSVAECSTAFKNLKTGSDWLKIEVNNGYHNKVKPRQSNFVEKNKLNYPSFVLKLEIKKKFLHLY